MQARAHPTPRFASSTPTRADVIVVVTGGRAYKDSRRVWAELSGVGPIRFLLHGGANGADAFAGRWAAVHDVDWITMPARWRDGISAGAERNERMLRTALSLRQSEEEILLVAFPGGAGTASCVQLAVGMGIPIKRIE